MRLALGRPVFAGKTAQGCRQGGAALAASLWQPSQQICSCMSLAESSMLQVERETRMHTCIEWTKVQGK